MSGTQQSVPNNAIFFALEWEGCMLLQVAEYSIGCFLRLVLPTSIILHPGMCVNVLPTHVACGDMRGLTEFGRASAVL